MSNATVVPLVDYLILGDAPFLEVNECTACKAHFFDRRNACANCSGTEFTKVAIPNDGELISFTIVTFAAPGVQVPFVSGIINCGGTSVRANLVNVEADPAHVTLGMKVKLTTFSMGADSAGTEAVGFGYEPA